MSRLDEWLSKSAKIPGFKTRSKTKKRIKEGCVQVNGHVTLKPAKKLKVLHLYIIAPFVRTPRDTILVPAPIIMPGSSPLPRSATRSRFPSRTRFTAKLQGGLGPCWLLRSFEGARSGANSLVLWILCRNQPQMSPPPQPPHPPQPQPPPTSATCRCD